MTWLGISATRIRDLLSKGGSPRYRCPRLSSITFITTHCTRRTDPSMNTSQIEKIVVAALEDIKGKDIEIINTSKLTPLF